MTAEMGSVPLLATRLVLGAGEGLALPAIHSMVRSYVPISRRSSSAATVTCGCYVGALASNLITPTLIQRGGWEWSFYFFAILPLTVWLPLWFRFMKFPDGVEIINNTDLGPWASVSDDISVSLKEGQQLNFLHSYLPIAVVIF